MNSPDSNWTLIAAAASSLTHGSQRLQNFIDALRRLLDEHAWKSYTHPNGTHHEFDRFADFVEHPHGLHATTSQVRNLVRDDPQLCGDLDAALAGTHGGDRRSSDFKRDNITLETDDASDSSSRGTGRAYRLRRLERDAPEYHARVVAGELSVHRAMIQAGLQNPKPSIPRGTPVDDVATTLRRRYGPDELATLRQLLDDEKQGP